MLTTIFDVPVRIAEDLGAVAFSPHPVTGHKPGLNPWDYTQAEESVIVVSRTNDDDAVAEWESMGRDGRGERYIVDVVVTTQVRGRTWAQMMERLDELTTAALELFTDDNGQFLPPGGVDADGANPYGIWTGMANAERSNQWTDDEGWYGQCRVAVRIAARI